MTHYAYASGVIKALEGRLLPKAKLYQLAESHNLEELFRSFSDTCYSGIEDELFTDGYFHKVEKGLTKIVDSLILEPEIKNIFLSQYDLLNLRVILKCVLAKSSPPDDASSPDGLVSYSAIKRYVSEGKYFLLPEPLSEICEFVLKKNKVRTALELDIAVDEIFFEWARSAVKDNKWYQEFLKLSIDVLNIVNFIRYRTFFSNRSVELEHKFFISGGGIELKLFEQAVKERSFELSGFFKKVAFFAYRDEFKEIDFQGDYVKDVSRFVDNVKTRFWKNLKLQPFGFHTVAGYLHAKKTELKNLRIIHNGVKSRIPAAVIKESLREPYI